MTSTIKLLDRWKVSQGIASDNAAALALEVSRQAASRWRNGLAQAEPHTIARMAKDIGDDAGAWMALVEAERAKSAEDRKVWMALARQLGAAAAVAAVALIALPLMAAHEGHYSALLLGLTVPEQLWPLCIMRSDMMGFFALLVAARVLHTALSNLKERANDTPALLV